MRPYLRIATRYLIALLLEPRSHVGEILVELGELFLHPMVVVHA